MKHEVDIMDSIYERIEAEGFDALTDSERYYFAIWWLEGEANNGAFDQYFGNSSGEFANEALQGLKAVGAHRMADIFEAAINLFPNSQVPTDREERNKVLDNFTPDQEQQLSKLTSEFTDYPDDLSSLLNAYVEEHQEQFLGPTTLLELWHAQRARGAETVPHRISNWDLEKEAEKDALYTDRKCPICEQPAPNYRKTCKRCGYPFGRVAGHQ
jgi:hypothetical protein